MGARSWWRNGLLAIALIVLLCPQAEFAAAAAPSVRYSISSSVSDEDASYVREGVSLAAEYLDDTLGGEIDDDLVVNVRASADPSDPAILAFASGDFLVVFTGSPYWGTLPPFLRLQTVIHEFIHIYQGDMLGNGEDASPMWFIEGMAEYLAYDAIARLGVVDEGEVENYQAWAVLRGGYDVVPLEDIEEIGDFQSAEGPVYSLAYLAVSRLVGDLPSKSLEDYLTRVDDGADWRDAFPDAFGVELDEFYDEFDAWVAGELDAPRRIPTAFREVAPAPREAPVTILSATDEIAPGEQALVLAETERGSECRFVLRDEDGQRLATLETFADRTGTVFWLVTIPESSPEGQSEVMVDCGDKRDRVKLRIVDD